MRPTCTTAILSAATATGAGSVFTPWGAKRTFQAYGTTSAGAGAASINIEGSNDSSNWLTIGNISLTLATTASNDGFASDAPWRFIRANVASISGTNASVSVVMGVE